jgi:hypothetical protein
MMLEHQLMAALLSTIARPGKSQTAAMGNHLKYEKNSLAVAQTNSVPVQSSAAMKDER